MKTKTIYIADCGEGRGIYRYHLQGDRLVLQDKTEAAQPTYLAIANHRLYTVLRRPFADGTSGVNSYEILPDGALASPTSPISTKGLCGAHILIDGEAVYCANYLSGSIILLPDTLVTHTGHGVNQPRQDSAHAHFVSLSPDQKYVFAVDLGIDTIKIYDKSLQLVSEAKVPDGCGCRHLAFSDDGKYVYCANELASSVSVFAYTDASLTLLGTYAALPADFDSKNTAAAIRYRNGYVYVSNRGHDSIACFKAEGDALSLQKIVPCGGGGPRDFDIFDDVMICTNEQGHNVTVLKMKDNIPTDIVSEITGFDDALCVCGWDF